MSTSNCTVAPVRVVGEVDRGEIDLLGSLIGDRLSGSEDFARVMPVKAPTTLSTVNSSAPGTGSVPALPTMSPHSRLLSRDAVG